MHAKFLAVSFSLTLTVLVCACQGRGDSPHVLDSQSDGQLPLSPGIQIASLVSGGIAGLNDSIQVTDDWQLIVVTRSSSFVRRLDGDEQMALREILKRFAVLSYSHSDGGPDVADGMSSTIVARGWGEGKGTKADAKALGELLGKLQIKQVPR